MENSNPELYRLPASPGFVGGYNWKSMIIGLLLLLATNTVATQTVAARFNYQPSLGTPIQKARRFSIYQPFAWAIWLWRYGNSSNTAVRKTLLIGPAIVVTGAACAVMIVLSGNLRKTRKLSRNTEDLHGSARWATKEDIAATGLLNTSQGVYVGGWYNHSNKRLEYLCHNGPEHILAFAPTRSGKGVSLVIPTLLVWNGSAVIYDIKGENWEKTAGFRQAQGHLCFKFSPVEESSSRFNPLAELRINTLRDVADAQNMADILVRSGENRPEEIYWQDAAASITTGMILHACYAAAHEGRVACLADLAHVFTRPGSTFRETLVELLNYQHDPEHRQGWHMPTGEATATHPVVREKAQEMLDKEEKDFSGVLSTAKTALTLFSDPLVARNTSASDFHILDLVNHESPISLYLVVPPSDKIRLRSLVRLIFTLVVHRLTEKMDFQRQESTQKKNKLLCLIDEFPSLKRMDVFADALSYMGGYGIKAYLIAQDIRQIVQEYGIHESIVSNCHLRVAFAPNQLETAEMLSRMTGMKTIEKATFNFSGSRISPIMDHINTSVDHVARTLMTPDEVLRLRPPRKERDLSGERIVEAGDMLIFASGTHPIYGRQILYFLDPILAARAAIPPPEHFVTILTDGKTCLQPPADQTENVLSRPELIGKDDQNDGSPMEKAFNESLAGNPAEQKANSLESPLQKNTLPQFSAVTQPIGYIEELELPPDEHSRD
jgi:type IV secretion system protein VirD4